MKELTAEHPFPPAGVMNRAGTGKLHIGLVLWPEFPLIALSGLMDALRYAACKVDRKSQTLKCLLSLISARADMPVASSAGIAVTPDLPPAQPQSLDYLAVLGGSLKTLPQGHSADRRYLTDAHRAGVPLIGIGTGSFILAKAGLLDGRRASVHPFHIAEFRKRFPQVLAEEGFDFIDEGDVLTCPGGVSTITLATELIRLYGGEETAANARHRLAIAQHGDMSVAVSRPANIALIADPRLRRVVLLIEQYLARPLNTAWLAHQVQLSARQLTRLFSAEFGKSPREYIRSARLRYACWLLNNTAQSITDIAVRMGFSDCAHFIRHFQQQYDVTPGQWRAAQRDII
ncbi:GlxA family transcriptional regulator [Rahnella victoriana]|uniref:GlxA family transcriptional regulator n=1 Tax=Rahnella victoriana TaxID=1510570 RepID=UPI001E54273A|nr:helix-turn-helix domain-containing protein [Rahnella victoriana]UHM89191.1 helix-turn-helix domain-containing protein [Rahnella victoriana]